MDGEKVKQELIKKYGNLSRFAEISGISYNVIQGAIRKNRADKLGEIMARSNGLENKSTRAEITDADREFIMDQITDKMTDDEFNNFCKDNGFYPCWLKTVVMGEVRFKNRKVTRLIQALKNR